MHLPVNAPHIRWICGVALIALAGCGPMPVAKSDNHIGTYEKSGRAGPATAPQNIPAPVKQVALPPPPAAKPSELKYSVVVNDVPVREVLFAIARETKLNIDIHPGIEGRITLNAIDQTVRQILDRIVRQLNVRIEEVGPNLALVPDTPYLKVYKVDYVNMARDSASSVGLQTQVVGIGSTAGAASGGQNSSTTKVDNTSKNRFWETLEKNIRDIIIEEDKYSLMSEQQLERRKQAMAAASTRPGQAAQATAAVQVNLQPQQEIRSNNVAELKEANPVITNPETGTLSVRATDKQHQRIAQFIEQVAGSAKRQVMIEATVVEVLLNDNYRSGVDWSAIGLDGLGYTIRQNLTGGNLAEAPFFSIGYSNPNAAAGGNVSSTIKLLSTYGTTRVLSSPRIMSLNNQTAVLKVVENKVYFTVQSQITPGTQGQAALVTYSSTQNVVPVGFVMTVTPQISEGDVVVLNVRPTVSKIISFVNDPNPDLARAGVISRIPEIQTREFETILRVPSGQTAVLGGLMQDSLETNRDGLPILSRVPILGDAVSYRNDTTRKSELVVFMRPVVIRDASTDTDLAEYRKYMPDSKFFKDADPLVPELAPPFTMKPNPVVPDAQPPKS
ncbi:MAG: secretin N-terminal domain-containing protein [Burkholderiales bacterium]|nr:secretin N-terminal domain-containing protein [Burkholderiales bacterium]